LIERCWDGNTADVGKGEVGRIVCDGINGGGKYTWKKRTSIPSTNWRKHWPLIVPRFWGPMDRKMGLHFREGGRDDG